MRNLIRLGAAIPALVLCLVFSSTTSHAAADIQTNVSSVSASGQMWGPITFKATLKADGAPLAGKSVVFTAGGNAAGSATTDADGVATLSTVDGIQSFVAGTYPDAVVAAFAGDAGLAASSAKGTLNVARRDQIIGFTNLRLRNFGEQDFRVSAFATSALPVTFSASGPCHMVGSSNLVHLTGAGTCQITASVVGNANFNPAITTVPIFVGKAFTGTTVTSSVNPSASGQSVTLTADVAALATTKPGIPTGSVQFKIDDAVVGSAPLDINGVAKLPPMELAAGSHTFTAEYGSDNNYGVSSGALTANSVVEFAQSSYTVAEGGALTVTVRRTGDTSQKASVDYATDDGGVVEAAAPCAQTGGLALARCDYTKALGTLLFAAGEAEKTFQILVADDSYAEGPETAHLRLSNATGNAAFGTNTAAAVTVTDDAPESSGNTADDSAKFVAQHYRDFLGREPDADGLAFWTNEIESCGADAGCREVKRIHVSAAFFLSIEAQETSFFVYRVYKAVFGDMHTPDLAGTVPIVRLDGSLSDTQQVGAGVIVGRGDWQARLNTNKDAYLLAFVRRQLFRDMYPLVLSADGFVDALTQQDGFVLTQSERAGLVNILGQIPSDAGRRAQVLRAVAENPRLRQAEFNRAFVLMQYFGYLRRDPDDIPDGNFHGWRFWLDKLEQFDGDFVRAEMVKAFIASGEYRKRFGQ
jgi:hypothetical protein